MASVKPFLDDFRQGRRPMVSAVGNQQEVTIWEYAKDSKGVYWFWPAEHKEPGSMVHIGETMQAGRRRSEGYAGRVMQFPTKDGVIEIQGPWHTNTDALYEATGVDLRDKHWTFGVVGMRREYEDWATVIRDVIHADPNEGVIGTHGRIKDMAQQFADELQIGVYYFSQSSGGSSCGPVYPTGWTREQQKAFHDNEMLTNGKERKVNNAK